MLLQADLELLHARVDTFEAELPKLVALSAESTPSPPAAHSTRGELKARASGNQARLRLP